MSKPSFFVQACLGGLLAASIFPCVAVAANPDQAQLEAMQRLNDSGDYAALRDLLEPFAQAGNSDAQYNLGVLLRDGLGVEKNTAQAKAWFEKAAAQNHDGAQNNLAHLLLGEEQPDYEKINGLFRAAAEAGNAEAQFNLGLGYDKGRGLPVDNDLKRQWYEKAATQGHRAAIHNLAVMYYNGKGVAQDYGKALMWYTKNAEAGDAEAQFNLGVMYSKGRGTAKDVWQARQWYEKAAAQGYEDAMENLGRLAYFELQDMQAAHQWWLKAAQAGRASAQFNLGTLYANGQGVEKNADTARAWFEKAAANGHEEARQVLEKLE